MSRLFSSFKITKELTRRPSYEEQVNMMARNQKPRRKGDKKEGLRREYGRDY